MDLLERLRPKWRHSDPEVRAAAVRDMNAGDRDRLATIVTEDVDARVRRMALKKLEDTAVLDRVAEHDADPTLRELAVERAREVRVRTACGAGAVGECVAALERISDERSLAEVAMTAVHDDVRQRALARVSGDRLLRDVVKGAADAGVRRMALERIADPVVLRGIAVGDGPADTTLQALERITDVEVLRAVADNRAASKAVRQRALAMLPAGIDVRPHGGGKDARVRQLELCATVEGLRKMSDVIHAGEQADEASREWEALARDVEPRPEVAERFRLACDAVLERASSLARRLAEAEHERDTVAQSLQSRRALCERVEAITGADAPAALAEAQEAWAHLPPVPEADGADLARRFRTAVDECVARHGRWSAQGNLRAEIDRLLETADGLADAGGAPATKAWRALERQWASHERERATFEDAAALEARFAAASERLAVRRQESDARRAEAEAENLKRLESLCVRIEALVAAERMKSSTGRRELLAVEAALQGFGPLPAGEQRGAWMQRLTTARDGLARRVAQDTETEEWRRWANAGAQEELIARVEAMVASDDLAESARQLGGLQDEWARIATASPEKSQQLWERFRGVRDQLRRRVDGYLAANLELKRALVAQVADLGDSTEWNATADLIKRLQAEWKTIGPVPARQTLVIWRQFREPCDRFFARRKEQFARVDAERSENATHKLALCEKAEALADSTDWDETAKVMKALQADWKRTGPPPRDQADKLWNRFRSACDRFFDRSKRRDELARDELRAQGEALCVQLETLAASLAGEDAPDDAQIGQTVDQTWADWLKLDLVTGNDAQALRTRLETVYQHLLAARPASLGGTRLDPEVTRPRREALCAKLEAIIPAAAEAPRQLSLQEMALALRDRLASNTIAAGGKKAEPLRQADRAQDLERITASWTRLGPVLDDAAKALAERFDRARAQVRPTR